MRHLLIALVVTTAECSAGEPLGSGVAEPTDTTVAEVATGPGTGVPLVGPEERAAHQAAIAQCLRDRGIDVEDPEPTDGPGGPAFPELDRSDADVVAALEACGGTGNSANHGRGPGGGNGGRGNGPGGGNGG